MRTGMPVLSSVNAWVCAMKNHSRKSLKLFGGERNLQVVPSAKMPKARVPSHLLEAQGMQMAPSMAPLRRGRPGWMSPSQILLTNYGFSLSSGYATSSQETDYVAVSEAAGFQPLRSVTVFDKRNLPNFFRERTGYDHPHSLDRHRQPGCRLLE